MASFQHAFPEQAENPLPAALPGETITITVLHRYRLRQLQDLAQAYGIELPEGATKSEILPILATHEAGGRFREPPKSRYHLIHAELNHDEKLPPHQRAEREKRLAEAFEAETEPRGPTQADLRARCKELGINTYSMTKEKMISAIADEEKRLAVELLERG